MSNICNASHATDTTRIVFVPWDDIREEVTKSFPIERTICDDYGFHSDDPEAQYALVEMLGTKYLLMAWHDINGCYRGASWHAKVYREGDARYVYCFYDQTRPKGFFAGWCGGTNYYFYNAEQAIEDLRCWARWYGHENQVVRNATDADIEFMLQLNQVATMRVAEKTTLHLIQEHRDETKHRDDTWLYPRNPQGCTEAKFRFHVSADTHSLLPMTEKNIPSGTEVIEVCGIVSDNSSSIEWVGRCRHYRTISYDQKWDREFPVRIGDGFSVERLMEDANTCWWCGRRVPFGKIVAVPDREIGLCPECHANYARVHG